MPKKAIIRFLALCLLLALPLQSGALAAESASSLYLEQNGLTSLLSAEISGDSLRDADQLLMIRRALACAEVDPQVVTLSHLGTAAPTLSLVPEYPDYTRSAALTQRAADIAAASAEQSGFRRQIRYIAEAIQETAQYDADGVKDASRCAYGALMEGLATCEGYANAFMLVCRAAGVPCVRVLGYRGGVYHTWNAVYDGSAWYMCDLTEKSFLLLSEDKTSWWSDISEIDWPVYAAAKEYCLGGGLTLAL